ncbi:MAG: hypothetical protein P8L78_04590 [Mariniblastus sp.]|nr:hypothetical protein [Mariniblastus sp.]
MPATHRNCPKHDSFEVHRIPHWRLNENEVILSFLTYTVALETFTRMKATESLVELLGITGSKPPKLLKTNKKGGPK